MTTQPVAVSVEWTLGDRLRRVRRSAGMTQDQFAHAIGVGTKAYAAWEADRNYPEHVVELARHIERTFGVRAAWLLGVDNESPHPAGPDGGGSVLGFQRRARRYSKPQPSDPKVGVSAKRAA